MKTSELLEIFSRNFGNFRKKKFRRLLDNLKFEILLIFQYHSKQNGFMEKKISPLKKSLRQLFINKVDLWGHQLGHAMFCRTKNRSSLFGKHVRKRVGDPFLRTYLEKLYSWKTFCFNIFMGILCKIYFYSDLPKFSKFLFIFFEMKHDNVYF